MLMSTASLRFKPHFLLLCHHKFQHHSTLEYVFNVFKRARFFFCMRDLIYNENRFRFSFVFSFCFCTLVFFRYIPLL